VPPLTVLYVHNSAEIAGGNRALLGLLENLNRERFRPLSLLPGHGPMEQELHSRDVPHLIVPIDRALRQGGLHALALIWRLARVLIRERVRLVHANDTLCYRYPSIAARLLGIHRICHLQFPPTSASLEWALAVRPDALITCSKHMGAHLRDARLSCLQSVPIVPVENAVDTERYRPPTDITRLTASLGIPEQAEIVTIVGSISERKGQREFLDAAKQVLARRPRSLFLIVGEDMEAKGAYRRAMEDYARALGIASGVRFLGFVSDTSNWVAASDVIVLPSLKEGLPLSLAEAHGCGKPVVATRVDGIPEIVAEGVTGFLFEPRDVTGMGAAITRLLEDESLRKDMGVAARQRAEEIFSQRSHAAKIQEIYQRVLGGDGA